MNDTHELHQVVPIVDLTPFEQEAQRLSPQDQTTANAAQLFLARVRDAEKKLESDRKAKTDILRADIERITAPYRIAIEAFQKLRTRVQGALNVYEARMEAQRLEDQRRANAEADRIRLLQEQKAEAARVKAEELRAAGDLLGALKQDTKADKAALVAATTAPLQVEAPPKTIKFDGGISVTKRKTKDWSYLNGEARGEKRYRDDPRFATLPDEVWVLDEGKIGSIIRSGGKVNGVRVFEVSTSVTKQE